MNRVSSIGIVLFGATLFWAPQVRAVDDSCVRIESSQGTADGGTETVLVDALRPVVCPTGYTLHVAYSVSEGFITVRAWLSDAEGDQTYESTAVLRNDGTEASDHLRSLVKDLTDTLSDVEDRQLRRKWPDVDAFRGSILVGAYGAMGGRGSLLTLKWTHAYFTMAQGGGIVGFHRSAGSYMFYSVEGGAVFRSGPHWLSLGLQVGLGFLHGDAVVDRKINTTRNMIGGMVSTTLRYRRYWGAFGLEAAIDWPIVFSERAVGTPWPIFALGFGM